MIERQILTVMHHVTKAVLAMQTKGGASVKADTIGPTYDHVAKAATDAIAELLEVSDDNPLGDELVNIVGSKVYLRPCLGMSPEEAKLCLEARISLQVRKAIGEAFKLNEEG